MSKQEMIRRAKLAIGDCDRFIAKESARDSATRPADMQKHLEFCKTRKAEMESMLAEIAA